MPASIKLFLLSQPPSLHLRIFFLCLSLFFLCSLSSVCFLFLFNFEATFMTATGAPLLVKMNKLFLFYVSPLLLNSLYTTILCHDFPAAAYTWAVSKPDSLICSQISFLLICCTAEKDILCGISSLLPSNIHLLSPVGKLQNMMWVERKRWVARRGPALKSVAAQRGKEEHSQPKSQ